MSHSRLIFSLCLLLLVPPASGGLLSAISNIGRDIVEHTIEKVNAVANTVVDAYHAVKNKIDEGIATIKSKVDVPPDWHCGTESLRITEIAAHTLLALNCGEEVKNEMNKACKDHDNCYRLRYGEKKRLMCDRDFCKALNTANAKADHEHRCQTAANTLCSAVAFGKFAHKPATPTTTIPTTTTPSGQEDEPAFLPKSADPFISLKGKFVILDFKGYLLLD